MEDLVLEMENLLRDFLNNYLNQKSFFEESGKIEIRSPEKDSVFWDYMRALKDLRERIGIYTPQSELEKRQKERSLAVLRSFSKELFQTFCYRAPR